MLRNMAVAIVLAHAAILAFHGTAHARLGIDAPGWHGPFIVLVIIVTPLVAAGLLVRRPSVVGFGLVAASMAASLVFGALFHFLLPGRDNVAEIAHHAWARTFRVSAMLLAVSEAAAVLVAAAGLVRASRGPS